MNLAWSLNNVQPRRWWEAVDPRLKLALLSAISLLAVLLDAPHSLALLALVALLLMSGLKMRPPAWGVILGLLLAIAWGTVLSQALFYGQWPRHALVTFVPAGEIWGWEYAGLHFYAEGARYGLTQSLRMMAVMLTGLSVCLSTSPERLLVAFAWLRLPTAVSFTTVAALRFLPQALADWSTVRQAQHLRGFGRQALSHHKTGFWRRIRGELSLLLPVMVSLVRRSGNLADSITLRGFDPARRRTAFPPLKFHPFEKLTLGLLIAVLLLVAAAKLLFWLYQADLYYASDLRWVYDFARRNL